MVDIIFIVVQSFGTPYGIHSFSFHFIDICRPYPSTAESITQSPVTCQSFLFINNAQVIVLKNSIKIYIKIAPTCFGAVTPSSGSALFVLAKVTLVKITD